jgi:hypothetical protein
LGKVSGQWVKARGLAYTKLMQRVSECEAVVFCGAAASPQGWPPPKTSLFIQKVYDCSSAEEKL